jgi:hypothetical protein
LVALWEEMYERSGGCVGVVKDWLTRVLAMVVDRGAATMTRTDLEIQALSKVKLVQMAREIKEGEERLTETDKTANELRSLLGMGALGTSASEAPTPVTVPGERRRPGRRVGERSPIRDAVGVAQRGG